MRQQSDVNNKPHGLGVEVDGVRIVPGQMEMRGLDSLPAYQARLPVSLTRRETTEVYTQYTEKTSTRILVIKQVPGTEQYAIVEPLTEPYKEHLNYITPDASTFHHGQNTLPVFREDDTLAIVELRVHRLFEYGDMQVPSKVERHATVYPVNLKLLSSTAR